jgi:putative NADH-flavin reductase
MSNNVRLRFSESALKHYSHCPPMLIEPGVRTGKFRLGGDSLITDEQGKSRVRRT